MVSVYEFSISPSLPSALSQLDSCPSAKPVYAIQEDANGSTRSADLAMIPLREIFPV